MIQPRFMRFAFVIAGMLVASHAYAEDAADDHPRLTLGTTGGATITSGNFFFIGQLDLRAQIARHVRMVFALQVAAPGTPCVDGPCPTPYYFATLASVQYDLTRAPDSNIWIGAATGVPLLVEGDASSGVIAAGELTIDIRISRDVSLEIAGRLGVERMSESTSIVSGTYPVGDARLGIAWDLTRTPRIEPHTTASR